MQCQIYRLLMNYLSLANFCEYTVHLLNTLSGAPVVLFTHAII